MTILEEIDYRERAYREQIKLLRQENADLRAKLWQEQLRSIEHGNEMFNLVFQAALEGALQKPKP